MRKLYLFAIILLLPAINLLSQTPTMQQKLYYTAKVWGFAKYYHSRVSTCNVNWDSVLLSVLPAVRGAATGNAFNDALDTMLAAAGPMALSAIYFPDTLPPALKRNRNWGWVDTSTILRSDVRIQLDTIKNNFRPHASCDIGTAPVTQTLYNMWGGYLEFSADTILLPVNTYLTYPDEDHRLLQLFKFWNIIRYFNPYNYVLDTSWETTLNKYAMRVDTASNAHSLGFLYLNMAAALQDAHVYGLTYSWYYFTPPDGYAYPPIRLSYAGGQYVVQKSLQPGVNPGDAILSMDGLTTTQWEDSLKQFYSAGNMAVFRRLVSENLLRHLPGATATLLVEDSTGASHTLAVPCDSPFNDFFYSYYSPADSLETIKWTTMPCDIGYANMGNMVSADVDPMYIAFYDKSVIIIDHRGNSDAALDGQLSTLMCPDLRPFARLDFPDTTYPGTYYSQSQYIGYAGNPTPFAGKVIVLVNEEAQSHVEYSAMMYSALTNRVIVGSQTAGADGNITWMGISNDFRLGWTSLGVYYPNGDSTQRRGIIIDSVVYPTKAGIRHHRDEVLEKALAIGGCKMYTGIKTTDVPIISVHPNPANEMVVLEAENVVSGEIIVAISDLTGRVLSVKNMNNTSGKVSVTFDTHQLSPGMYFLRLQTAGGMYVSKIIKE